MLIPQAQLFELRRRSALAFISPNQEHTMHIAPTRLVWNVREAVAFYHFMRQYRSGPHSLRAAVESFFRIWLS
jgi:hypothetical protein